MFPDGSKSARTWLRVLGSTITRVKDKLGPGAPQSVNPPTSTQVTISRVVSSSPTSGSVLTAQSLEPASDSVSPSLSAPPLLALYLNVGSFPVCTTQMQRWDRPRLSVSVQSHSRVPTASQRSLGQSFSNGVGRRPYCPASNHKPMPKTPCWRLLHPLNQSFLTVYGVPDPIGQHTLATEPHEEEPQPGLSITIIVIVAIVATVVTVFLVALLPVYFCGFRRSLAPATKMASPEGARRHFSKGLLLSASILALWVPQGSRAALRIQKIPEHPQKNQDLLLSVRGIPDTFQDFNWYLGEEAHGGTMLFTYIPELQRPQRDGGAMGQRDIVGFPNGSMLLHRAQPTDSGTYQVAVTINPAWTMRAKTKVRVEEKHKEPPITHLPMSAGIMVAIIIGSLAAGALFIGSIAHLLLTRSWRGQSHRMPAPGGQGSLSVLFPAVSPVASTGPSPRSVFCKYLFSELMNLLQ
ncbi:carcinoembryonic antigen-related cell adhesion [Lynx pardinus]|uniref:Carcinoembryonic antigen-related cell adhesion n=1 Tax=Lynx pardinus TaxID=191816 RepID=A0A485NJC8_LYNPA|nr:carcinoembryonic antigen-related cell adhesion [Lynx pardinus]